MSSDSTAGPISQPRLILASASPRRRQLLEQAGYEFVVQPADIDEEDHPADLSPGDLAQWLAVAKARVLAERFPRDVVLAADTVVAHETQLLGKPTDAEHARWMLQTLSGTTHHVFTGVALICRERGLERQTRAASAVHMRPLTEVEIEQYVASNDWMGKAGGYGIQDADPFVTRISGDLTNIVGLPMEVTTALLAEAGIEPVRLPDAARETRIEGR
jgi:septum formation protein